MNVVGGHPRSDSVATEGFVETIPLGGHPLRRNWNQHRVRFLCADLCQGVGGGVGVSGFFGIVAARLTMIRAAK
jgi:hypothetical protein